MKITFLAQPDVQVGRLLETALNGAPPPGGVTLVSAFAGYRAVMRVKAKLLQLHAGGTKVRVVVGVDMGGTSREVLTELQSWPVEVLVFKNRKPGVTFHPKLYLVEGAASAELFVGSNNLTDAGLFGNYEGAAHVTFSLPADVANLATAKKELSKFLAPLPAVSRKLDKPYLEDLLACKQIPSEREARKRRSEAVNSGEDKKAAAAATAKAFGYEVTPSPPPLPPEVQKAIVDAVRKDMAAGHPPKSKKAPKGKTAGAKAAKAPAAPAEKFDPLAIVPRVQIFPEAFYMELTTTGAAEEKRNIPGEQRIPLEAVSSAREFWGWPDNYTKTVSPRAGKKAKQERIYIEWKPEWRVLQRNVKGHDVTKPVRLYYYKNSSDFRFYSGDLARWASAGDIVRITKSEDPNVEFECVLAAKGSADYAKWRQLCTMTSDRSPRVFGFE